MNYFNFKKSAESSEIGVFPQSRIYTGVNPNDVINVWNVKPFEFPDFLPNLELEMLPRANLTDMISSVAISNGFIVNDKLMSILKGQNLPNHAFYPGKLYTNGFILNYNWFHFMSDGFWDWIDKNKSKLSRRSIIPDHREKILDEVNLFKTNFEFVSIANSAPSLQDIIGISWFLMKIFQNSIFSQRQLLVFIHL